MGRDRCKWSSRESYSAGVPRLCRASKLHQCERHKSVAPVQDGTEGVQLCEMHGVVAAAQRSKREHLSVTEGALAS